MIHTDEVPDRAFVGYPTSLGDRIWCAFRFLFRPGSVAVVYAPSTPGAYERILHHIRQVKKHPAYKGEVKRLRRRNRQKHISKR